MPANGADSGPSPPNPRLEDLRRNLRILKERLAYFQNHTGTVLAGDGRRLTPRSRGLWDQARGDVGEARGIYEQVDARRQREESFGETAELAEALEQLRHATVLVQKAIDRADTLERVCVQLLDRAQSGQAKTKDPDVAGLFDDYIDRLKSDPFSQSEEELRQIEQVGYDVEVRAARGFHGELRRALSLMLEAVRDIAHFDPGPLSGLDKLAASLARLERARRTAIDAETAQALERWRSDAQRIGGPIKAAAARAEELLLRRDRRRGLLRVLEARAKSLEVETCPEVATLLSDVLNELWIAPTDLERAEALLLRLEELLNEKAA